ncbi:MAG: Uma2 family endonuclease [Saprospiraceae bacterium]|nr:Uma2 family endonuclease [Saprospiraceae bacterium]
MSAYQVLLNYTYEDYLLWEGRWEIIHGIPYAMSPMPSPRHQRLAGRIHSLFLNTLTKNDKCQCQVYQPIDLKINEHTVVNPDILIVCKPIMKQFLDFPPALVVEILSPSSEMKDRYTKFQLYETFLIPYYIIIDPEAESVEIYGLNGAKKYELVSDPNALLSLMEDCLFTPDWSNVFAE